jgi:hypothetical protein
MTMASLPPARCLPLPRVPGPRLGPFTPTGHADLNFLERLSNSDAKDGYVWKVEIRGRVYALKVVSLWTRRSAHSPGAEERVTCPTDLAFY